MKKIINAKTIANVILLTFIGSIIYLVVKIVCAPAVAPSTDMMIRVKSEYVFMLMNVLLGTIALLIPRFLRRAVRLNIPSFMLVAYAVFLFCAIYLGEMRGFYSRIACWDSILHGFSGAALGALGFSLVSLMNKSEADKGPVDGGRALTSMLSPVFIAMFSFCFALSLGVIWEIYEFTMDSLIGTNSQRYAMSSGELFVGHAALVDTMKDLIVDTVGAAVMSGVGFILLKRDREWLDRIKIHVS